MTDYDYLERDFEAELRARAEFRAEIHEEATPRVPWFERWWVCPACLGYVDIGAACGCGRVRDAD